MPGVTWHMTAQPPVGIALRARRDALALSRERLGARAGGISSATIARIERGAVTPHPATVAALAMALGCEPDDLLENVSSPGATPSPTNEGIPGADAAT